MARAYRTGHPECIFSSSKKLAFYDHLRFDQTNPKLLGTFKNVPRLEEKRQNIERSLLRPFLRMARVKQVSTNAGPRSAASFLKLVDNFQTFK